MCTRETSKLLPLISFVVVTRWFYPVPGWSPTLWRRSALSRIQRKVTGLRLSCRWGAGNRGTGFRQSNESVHAQGNIMELWHQTEVCCSWEDLVTMFFTGNTPGIVFYWGQNCPKFWPISRWGRWRDSFIHPNIQQDALCSVLCCVNYTLWVLGGLPLNL